MKAFLFPGQGSQEKGMGKLLFEAYPDYIKQASDLLSYDLASLCLNDPEHKLNQTQYTQPALYVVSALSYLNTLEKEGEPQYLAGHSLGEYVALFAAGCFDFLTGLSLVQERGRLMAGAQGGAMLAVIGLKLAEVKDILQSSGLKGIDIANHNAPDQVVISATSAEISQAEPLFSKYAKMCIPLKVSGAFHSRHMEAAKNQFSTILQSTKFSTPKIPVIANLTARPYQANEIASNLLNQISHTVRWVESIEYLIDQGVDNYQEVGPGRVLKGLLSKITVAYTPPPAKTKVASVSNGENSLKLSAETLGSPSFKNRYGIRYAYVAGAMYKGIAGKELVERMARSRLLSFLGTGGCSLEKIENDIAYLSKTLSNEYPYGSNLICNLDNPDIEHKTVEILLRYGISVVEASAFMRITPALVYFRLSGLEKGSTGEVITKHHIVAKLSRPEVAQAFMSPPPESLVNDLLKAHLITPEQAALGSKISMASDICVEADSGGHTDQGVLTTMVPTIIRLRDVMQTKYQYAYPIHIGAAGGLGTPEAIAAAFVLGADFVVTGSINQCTVEAAVSDKVKSILETINIQDTTYAPAGDMFEIGAKVQVVSKGLLFAPRANKLFQIYTQYNSLDEIDQTLKERLQKQYFKRSFEEIWSEVVKFFSKTQPEVIAAAERSPKKKMALIFRWYFGHTGRIAREGIEDQSSDYQIHCGPALGAFNQWVKDTEMETWRNRHVDKIGENLMLGASKILNSI